MRQQIGGRYWARTEHKMRCWAPWFLCREALVVTDQLSLAIWDGLSLSPALPLPPVPGLKMSGSVFPGKPKSLTRLNTKIMCPPKEASPFTTTSRKVLVHTVLFFFFLDLALAQVKKSLIAPSQESCCLT